MHVILKEKQNSQCDRNSWNVWNSLFLSFSAFYTLLHIKCILASFCSNKNAYHFEKKNLSSIETHLSCLSFSFFSACSTLFCSLFIFSSSFTPAAFVSLAGAAPNTPLRSSASISTWNTKRFKINFDFNLKHFKIKFQFQSETFSK